MEPFFREDEHAGIRAAVSTLRAGFPGVYWRRLDESRGYPTAFVATLTDAGFLSVLILEQYGDAGLGLAAAAACRAQI